MFSPLSSEGQVPLENSCVVFLCTEIVILKPRKAQHGHNQLQLQAVCHAIVDRLHYFYPLCARGTSSLNSDHCHRRASPPLCSSAYFSQPRTMSVQLSPSQPFNIRSSLCANYLLCYKYLPTIAIRSTSAKSRLFIRPSSDETCQFYCNITIRRSNTNTVASSNLSASCVNSEPAIPARQ